MRKPNLTARENENLIEILMELGLEMKGGHNFVSPKPIKTKDELKD